MSNTNICPVCGQSKPRNRRLCRECYEIYGGSADEWSSWLRELVNSADRLRDSDKQKFDNEIPFNDFESYIDQYWSDPEVLNTRPRDETRIVTDAYGSVAIPYAPYDDEDMNKAYREANGIPEESDDLDAQVIAIY